ncbi:MAG: hypothetical protein ACM3RP_11065 [Chitinophagales bacterium]
MEFRSAGSATLVKWTVEFTPQIPGTGWIVGRVMRGVLDKFLAA